MSPGNIQGPRSNGLKEKGTLTKDAFIIHQLTPGFKKSNLNQDIESQT